MLPTSALCLLLLGWLCLLSGCGANIYDYSLGQDYVLVRAEGQAPMLYYEDPQRGLVQLLNAPIMHACSSSHYVLLQVNAHRYEGGKAQESFYLVDQHHRRDPGYGVFGPYSRQGFRLAVQQAHTPNCLLASQ